MKGFNASYEILDVKKSDEVTVSIIDQGSVVQSGTQEININDIISQDADCDVDEVYYVKLKCSWEYNGLKYGNDPKWWDSIRFEDYTSLPEAKSYESYTKYMEDKEYNAFVYKSGDNWYFYRPEFMNASGNYTIESK